MSNIKIYISFDFEGLGGISQRDDVTSDNKDYKQKYAVAQLNALFEQLRDHEVVISDSHDKGNNIPWEITN
ncbi:MAG TPA: peptidase M55, partial [Defluviitoga tunisiensis]|nr:peptidase M55 [Defluviitoga tunisiensis]